MVPGTKNEYMTQYDRYMSRYINSQGGKTGYWLSLLSLVAAGALLNLIPTPHQVGVDVVCLFLMFVCLLVASGPLLNLIPSPHQVGEDVVCLLQLFVYLFLCLFVCCCWSSFQPYNVASSSRRRCCLFVGILCCSS